MEGQITRRCWYAGESGIGPPETGWHPWIRIKIRRGDLAAIRISGDGRQSGDCEFQPGIEYWCALGTPFMAGKYQYPIPCT